MTPYAQAALVFAAYIIGGVSFGYWLVRLRTGKDIRTQGSCSAGATNVGRILGTQGFVLVLALDLAKAALCVAAARHYFQAPEITVTFTAAAVVLGHIWPLQLKFRGGKGIAPLIGAWLILCPPALLPTLAITLLAYAAIRSFTISGLVGLLALPVSTWWFTRELGDEPALQTAALALLTLAAVLYAHRANISQYKQRLRSS